MIATEEAREKFEAWARAYFEWMSFATKRSCGDIVFVDTDTERCFACWQAQSPEIEKLSVELAAWKSMGFGSPNAVETVIRAASEQAKIRESKLRAAQSKLRAARGRDRTAQWRATQ